MLDTTFNWAKNVGKDGNGNDDESYLNAHYPGNGVIAYNDFATLDYAFSYGTQNDWNGLGTPSMMSFP